MKYLLATLTALTLGIGSISAFAADTPSQHGVTAHHAHKNAHRAVHKAHRKASHRHSGTSHPM